MSNKPFSNPYDDATLVRNVIFDHIMPALSSPGWKVLCVAIRQSWGGGGQKAEGQTSVSQFMAQSGIKEQDVVEKALEECLEAGYLVRHQAGSAYVYTLAAEFELDEAAPSRPEVEPVEEDTILDLSAEQRDTVQALWNFGRDMESDPDLAQVQEAVLRNDAEAVLAWIETGREMMHLKEPMRFQTVVQRLLDQVPPLLVPAFELDQPQEKKEVSAAEPKSGASAAHELWQTTLETLRPRVKKNQYKWLHPTQGVELAANVLTVAAPNKRAKEWLEEGQLTDVIQEALQEAAGRAIELVFVVDE